MDAIKVFVVDTNPRFRYNLRQYINALLDMDFVGEADSGVGAIEAFDAADPDMLLFDIALHGCDGFDLLKRLKEKKESLRAVLVSKFNSDYYLDKASRMCVDYFMLKPCDISILCERIREICGTREMRVRIKPPKVCVEDLLMKLAMPASLSGHQYICRAVDMICADSDLLNCLTKRLYPKVAELFGTKSSNVERSIRHAIFVAHTRSGAGKNTEIPSNRQFLMKLMLQVMPENAEKQIT